MRRWLARLLAALHGRTVPPAEPWPHRLDYSRELADRYRRLPPMTDLFVDRPFDASPADTPITPPDALAPLTAHDGPPNHPQLGDAYMTFDPEWRRSTMHVYEPSGWRSFVASEDTEFVRLKEQAERRDETT